MAKPTILFGIILIALGLIAYFGTPADGAAADDATPAAVDADADADATTDTDSKPSGGRSVTALIPLFFGVPLLICGVLALKESRLKHAMHGAAVFGLIGALAGIGRGASQLGKFFSGDPSLNTRAFGYVWAMGIICAVFMFMCIRSFIAAKKRRLAAEAAGSSAGTA